MKRTLALLLILLLALSAAQADPLTQIDDLTAEFRQPEDGSLLIFRYAFPQVASADSEKQEAVEEINAFYAYEAYDAEAFKVPMAADEMEEAGEQGEVTVSYTVTCSTEKWFSVLLQTETRTASWRYVSYKSQVFACETDKPGNVISLPYLLGILDEGEDDTWLQTRQTERADACVQRLVWEALERRAAAGEFTLPADVNEETFAVLFSPEEDFYLDENEQPVFYLKPGLLGDSAAGLITIPFTLDELLDEI